MGLISNLKASLFPEATTPDSPPAWIGRLKESKYVSISGIESSFLYLDLTSFFPLKTSVFESVTGNGAYVQQNGIGGLRFPVAMVFTGSDNDEDAKTCIRALTDQGEGTLYHPVHGRTDVAPVGEIEQVNAFVTAANQTIVTVELVETTGLLIDNLPPFDSVLDSYLDNAADSFGEVVNIDDPADEVSFGNKVVSTLATVKQTLDRLSDGVAETQAEMDDTFDSINSGIDTLVKDPIMLAKQMRRLISTPARRTGLIKSKLEGYGAMARSLFITPKPNGYDYVAQNSFSTNRSVAGAAISSAAQSVYDAEFQTRSEYIAAAVELNALANEFSTWSDDSAVTLGVESGNDWQDLLDVVGQSSASLISASFSALTEFTVTTEYERAAADWCFELYGSVKNDKLWFFAETNNLGGDAIITIEAGRELVYYE